MNLKINADVAKETLIILSYCDDAFVKCIPKEKIKELTILAADSEKEFYIEKNKPLKEQNISNECRSLLGDLYKTYVVNSYRR